MAFLPYCGFSQQSRSINIKWIDTDTGLEQGTTTSFLIDPQGYLLIGTQMGLYRYDGKNLVTYKNTSSSGNVKRIVNINTNFDDHKIIIRSSPDDRISTIKNGQLVDFDTNGKSPYYLFSRDVVYTRANKLVKKAFENKKYLKYFKYYEYVNSNNKVLFVDRRFYIFQPYGLVSFDAKGTATEVQTGTTAYKQTFVINTSIFLVGDGVQVIENGAIVANNYKISPFLNAIFSKKNIQNKTYQIFANNNQVFLSYNGKIYKITTIGNYVDAEYLFDSPENILTNITYNAEFDQYYVGTVTKGLAIIQINKFNTLYIENPKYNPAINSNYAVANYNDHEWYSPTGWHYNLATKKLTEDKHLRPNVFFLFPYENKQIMYADDTSWDLKTNKHVDLDFEAQVPKNEYGASAAYGDVLYVKQKVGIVKIKDKRIIEIPALKTYFQNFNVPYLLCLNANTLLIATDNGLYSYDERTQKITKENGLGAVNARYLKKEGKGYWVGTYGQGLYYVEDKVYKVKFKNTDIITAHAIEEDKNQNFWISTNNGLLFLHKKDLLYNTLHNLPVECYIYTTQDGLYTNEFNGGCYPASLQTKSGIIGFPSMKGFVWFNPQKTKQNVFTYEIAVEKVRADELLITQKDGSYGIPNTSQKIVVYFSYPYYFNRKNITVQYRIDDKPLKAVTDNQILLVRDQDGLHTLEIIVHTNGTPACKDKKHVLLLDYQPKFKETPLFIGLIVVTLVLLLLLVYNLGQRINKKRTSYLNNLVKEKTKELGLNLEKLIKSEKLNKEVIANKEVLLKEVHHRVKNNLQLIISMMSIQARRAKDEALEQFVEKGRNRINSMMIIHQTLYQEDSLNRIAMSTYFKVLCTGLSNTFEKSSTVKVKIVTHNIRFSINTAILIGLIVNEIITNAFKHAFPNNRKGTLKISMTVSKELMYTLIIEDDGIGIMDEDLHKKSFGIDLIKHLVEQLKGSVTIKSGPTTTYEINFPEIKI